MRNLNKSENHISITEWLNENLKDDKLKEYLSTERKAISDLYTFTKQKALIYQNSITEFEVLKPQIDEILIKQ